jgi:crossover junction endonuclease MUS81
MNTTLILEIDYRETAIIKMFNDSKNIPYVVKNLPVGDFIFKEDNSDSIHYIIERKNMNDLASSIVDGRFREQKQRLFDSVGTVEKIVYLIEGNKNLKKYGSIPKTTLDSSILNLIFKHQYKVVYTLNELDTYELLSSLYKKLISKDYCTISNVPVKLIKKGDNTSQNVFVNMLSVIQGVSIQIAKKIQEKYTTLPDLIKEYNNLTDVTDKEKLLCEIRVTDKRKLGISLSKKIYNSLFVNKEVKNEDKCLLD